MAVLINDFFQFFRLYTVSANVPDIVFVPLRLQLPELHKPKLAQEPAGFE